MPPRGVAPSRADARRLALATAILVLLLGGCAAPSPSLAQLSSEPVLAPLDGETVLLEYRSSPRRGRIGIAPRDGAVERVVALAADPADVASMLQRRFDDRYQFRRTDLGPGTPVTVELRGRAATGPVVVATASTLAPVPLFAPLAAVRPVPIDKPTSLVITVISRQG